MGFENFSILNLVLSTVAFFVASYYCNRYLDEFGLPKGMTRSILVFSVSVAISYAVGFGVDLLVT